MGRPSKGGAHKVVAKGNVYWYAWKGGPRLKSAYGTRAFDNELAALCAGKPAPAAIEPAKPKGAVLADVIKGYLISPEFLRDPKQPDEPRSERTQRDYRKLAQALADEFGDLEVAAFHETPDETRGTFLDWRDALAQRSRRQADYAWTFLNIVLNWGKQRGKIKLNPCKDAGVRSLYQGTRRKNLWTPADVEAFRASASAELVLGLALAYWTGQRQGDLMRLPWSAYDGDTITLKQSKGGVELAFPVASPLKALLDATPRKSPIIMVNQDGAPWSENGFGHMFCKTKNRLGLRHLTFHDLRGTVATELARAGCTEAEIASVTGHQNVFKNPILRQHYLELSLQLARTAIAKLETFRGGRPSQVLENSAQPIDFIKAKKRVLEN